MRLMANFFAFALSKICIFYILNLFKVNLFVNSLNMWFQISSLVELFGTASDGALEWQLVGVDPQVSIQLWKIIENFETWLSLWAKEFGVHAVKLPILCK